MKDEDLYRMPARARYRTDSEFRQLVDYMRIMVERSQFSPSELREAALLACVMYEETRLCAYILDNGEMKMVPR